MLASSSESKCTSCRQEHVSNKTLLQQNHPGLNWGCMCMCIMSEHPISAVDSLHVQDKSFFINNA